MTRHTRSLDVRFLDKMVVSCTWVDVVTIPLLGVVEVAEATG